MKGVNKISTQSTNNGDKGKHHVPDVLLDAPKWNLCGCRPDHNMMELLDLPVEEENYQVKDKLGIPAHPDPVLQVRLLSSLGLWLQKINRIHILKWHSLNHCP